MREQPLGPLVIDVSACTLLPEERERLAHPMVGGVILFSRNYEGRAQITSMIAAIKALRRPALLVAVDQEGGRVQRFREGFTLLPAARRLGELYDRDAAAGLAAARSAGLVMAAELREIGVDLSFAPVLDVATVASDVIGDRAFHDDPGTVAVVAAGYIEGMRAGGMRATGKHFPGHGGVSGDSHTCVPCDRRAWEQIDRCDLVPYRALASRLDGVMTAHVSFPEVDPDLPTFSRRWVGQVLREDVGFAGVVFSDDLSMDGAKVAGGPEERVKRALAAGCDMVLICNDTAAVDGVLDNVAWRGPGVTPPKVLAFAGATPAVRDLDSARRAVASLGEERA